MFFFLIDFFYPNSLRYTAVKGEYLFISDYLYVYGWREGGREGGREMIFKIERNNRTQGVFPGAGIMPGNLGRSGKTS